MKLERFFENTEILHVNCCENRSYYIPYSDQNDALTGVREKSDRFFDLCGTWKFKYFDSIYECPEFVETGLENYDLIPVPSNWQMLGYDKHQYVNTRYPFPYDPPYVPHQNPCGAYEKEFEFCKDNSRQYYLNFEGVDSCFYVWVNKTFVGYSQVSHSTSEWDITDYLVNGTNTLNVLVLKWCDGSYLEDQDKFRMSGIFRCVYILDRNIGHIRDFFIKTKNNGAISIDTYGADIEAQIYDSNNLIDSSAGKNPILTIPSPQLWNAENPYLYTLIIKCAGEIIVQKVGIREISVKNGIVYLNGQRLRILGTNRHDSDPQTGYVISYDQAMTDLKMMKENNMNGLRTSHYPNSPWLTQMCDEIGLYVVAEADIESHGCCSFYGASQETTFGLIAQDKRFKNAIIDRIQRCVIRDKNRPSILLWSLGNESGYGESFEAALEWLKDYDPSRLTHYESSVHQTLGHTNDTHLLDVYSTMYASPEWIKDYFSEPSNTKPYMQCEYIHAMGNSPGGIEDYTALMDKNKGFFAAFVWEWCDHGIYAGTENGRKKFLYGGDFGEFPHDGNFCMDGLVYPDRRPHTGLLEFKNNIRPIRARMENGIIYLQNRLAFTNTNDYASITAQLYKNGLCISSQDLTDINIEPWCESAVNIAILADKPLSDPDSDYGLKLTYYQKSDRGITKAGREMGFDFIMLQEGVFRKSISDKPVTVQETETEVIVSGTGFSYVYDKLKGDFKVIKSNSAYISPLEWNIWRAPTDNDRNIKSSWQNACFDRAYSRAYQTTVDINSCFAVITTQLSITAVYTQRILDIEAKWIISGDGSITLHAKCSKTETVPFIPRLGLRMALDNAYNLVSYYGYGPYESYIDKKEASYPALFTAAVKDMHEDYIYPQENGSHCGCKYMSISDGKNQITVTGQDFSFNASEYTQEELTAKAHNFELQKSGYTIVCIDGRQSGIGSNSCGPELKKSMRTEGDFEFEFTIRF